MNKIAGYRTMLGLTQKEMADTLEISKQSYFNKEHEKTPFTDREKVIFKSMLEPIFPDIKIDDIFFNQKVLKV